MIPISPLVFLLRKWFITILLDTIMIETLSIRIIQTASTLQLSQLIQLSIQFSNLLLPLILLLGLEPDSVITDLFEIISMFQTVLTTTMSTGTVYTFT